MSTEDSSVVGRGVSAGVLRFAILLLGAAIMAVPVWEGVVLSTLLLLCPLVLASGYAPASPAPAGVIVVAALFVALSGDDPLRVGVLVLVPLIHLFHLTCGIAGVLPDDSRLHPSAFRAPLLRFVTVQAVMAGLVVLVAAVPTGRVAPLLEAAALAGLAVVALLVLWRQRVK